MSLVKRKQVFGVSDQIPHKPGCTATKGGYRLAFSDLESRDIVLCSKNKGADQLRGDREADLRLLFSHMQNVGILMTRLSVFVNFLKVYLHSKRVLVSVQVTHRGNTICITIKHTCIHILSTLSKAVKSRSTTNMLVSVFVDSVEFRLKAFIASLLRVTEENI